MDGQARPARREVNNNNPAAGTKAAGKVFKFVKGALACLALGTILFFI
jgi:hypothetical protein